MLSMQAEKGVFMANIFLFQKKRIIQQNVFEID